MSNCYHVLACRAMDLVQKATASTVAGLIALGALAAHAQPAQPAQPAPDDLSVYVLTMGPGDHPFFKFGHNALWIQARQAPGMVFNWGTFVFDSPLLIPQFLRGRLKYWLSVSDVDMTIDNYRSENRTLEAQELDLSTAQKRELLRRLLDNARPQNRAYLYDYFWDNCSTRVRDAIDAVIGGRIKAAASGPATMTFRDQALRLTADLIPEYVGLHLGLGSLTDRPTTRFEETFIPAVLQAVLRDVRLAGPDGERPLVKAERTIFAADRPAKPVGPPAWTLHFALVGVAVALVFVGAGAMSRRSRAARAAFGALISVVGLVCGLLGTVLVLLWVATNHRSAHANENIFQLAPWTLALAYQGARIALDGPAKLARAHQSALQTVLAAAALSLLGIAGKVFTPFGQNNWAFIFLLLPTWSGLALSLHLAHLASQRRT